MPRSISRRGFGASLLALGFASRPGRAAGLDRVTRSGPRLQVPTSTPAGEVWRYGIAFPFQVGPREAAIFCNIRKEHAPGFDYEVGTGGSRLSLAQRQRTAIARALLKHPDLLILNEATTALDAHAQAKVGDGILEDMTGRGLSWGLHRASLARSFDRVLVLGGGRLQEQGTFAELDRKDTLAGMLMAAE